MNPSLRRLGYGKLQSHILSVTSSVKKALLF